MSCTSSTLSFEYLLSLLLKVRTFARVGRGASFLACLAYPPLLLNASHLEKHGFTDTSFELINEHPSQSNALMAKLICVTGATGNQGICPPTHDLHASTEAELQVVQ